MLAILMKICYIHLRSDYIWHTDRGRLHVTNYSHWNDNYRDFYR